MTDLVQFGFSSRLVPPYGSGANRVLILGEAPGAEEDEGGIPFSPGAQAGSVLERAIRRLGHRRESFVLTNTVPYRPPKNFLEKAPYEMEACAYGLSLLESTIARFRPAVIVALGNIALRAATGLAGDKLSVSYLTGFHLPSRWQGVSVVPCFHPSYLRRGAMSHMSVLLRALRLAMQIATSGRQPLLPSPDNPPSGYVMFPTEADAISFKESIRDSRIAYDIETPYSTNESEAEEAEGEQTIKSIQFSLAPSSGIFLPWRHPFISIAQDILSLPNPKLGWNIWKFDDPVLLSSGVSINGESHDLMWAWHHTQPDLPRGLQFAAAQLGWPWPWKHLDSASPAFYGIVDVDVLQWMTA